MREAVGRFATHHPADSALDTNSPDADPSLVLELRHILALQVGRPFTHLSLPGAFAFSILSEPTHRGRLLFQLNGRHIAYILGRSRSDESLTVVVRDLVSGNTATVRGHAREPAMNLALSTNVVAFVTFTGILYVASLLDPTALPSRVRLPSSCTTILAAGGGTVACHLSLDSIVVIYRSATRKSSSFSLESARTPWEQADSKLRQRVFSMSVDEDRQTIDIAAVVSCDHSHTVTEAQTGLRVVVSRFSLAGEYVTQVTWEQQVPGLRGDSIIPHPLQPTGDQGAYSMELGYHYHNVGPAIYHENRLTQPESTPLVGACLTLLYDEAEMSLRAVDLTMSPAMGNRPLLWKGRLHRVGTHTGPMAAFYTRPGPKILDAQSCDRIHTLKQLNEQFKSTLGSDKKEGKKGIFDDEFDGSRLSLQARSSLEEETCHEVLAMNDSFIVTSSFDHFEVACFDERIKLHGAESTELWNSGFPCTLPPSSV